METDVNSSGGFTFETQVSKVLTSCMPEGWVVTRDSDPVYDILATSPTGNAFPIEIKGGTGVLDVSAVVDFGAGVEANGTRFKEDVLTRGEGLFDHLGALNIKPVIVTAQTRVPASDEYSSIFHIEVIEVDSGGDDHSQLSEDSSERLGSTIAETLTRWNGEMEEFGQSEAAVRGDNDLSPDWFRALGD